MELSINANLTDKQKQLLNKLTEFVNERIELSRQKHVAKRSAYCNDGRHVQSDKYIQSFIKKRLKIDGDNDTLTFIGTDRYEIVEWKLETDDQCKRVATYISQSCQTY